jgi:lactoylglutathione lyase
VHGVDHIGLTVVDLGASEAFFVDVLGFEQSGRNEDYPAVFLRNDAVTVTLWRAADPATAVHFDRRGNVGLHHLALSVDSFEALDRLHERISRAPGAKIEFAPEAFYGGPAPHMMIREPSGNRLEFIHRP